MPFDSQASAEVARPPIGAISMLARFALIGIILAAVVGTFVYLGGWLSPHELTPSRFVDGFEQVNGVHAGFRRNHAKGVGVSGFFESNGDGVRLSKATVFRAGTVAVIGRFSLGGGLPDMVDKPDAVRGLGLEFSLPDGEFWRTAMINFSVFPFNTPEAFYKQMIASKADPATGKPDPAKLDAFFSHHPETVQALKIIKSGAVSSGFGNSTFYGLNAFRFVDAAGASVPVRWYLKPDQPLALGDVAANDKRDVKNYLFDALIAQIHHRPLQWHLMVIVGQPGDATNDATIAWPAGREQVDVGTLTLDRVESEAVSAATDINFDPLVLPSGIVPSDDPLLSARSAVYSQSFTRREGETKQPNAITPAETVKGGR
jgi:catalase